MADATTQPRQHDPSLCPSWCARRAPAHGVGDDPRRVPPRRRNSGPCCPPREPATRADRYVYVSPSQYVPSAASGDPQAALVPPHCRRRPGNADPARGHPGRPAPSSARWSETPGEPGDLAAIVSITPMIPRLSRRDSRNPRVQVKRGVDADSARRYPTVSVSLPRAGQRAALDGVGPPVQNCGRGPTPPGSRRAGAAGAPRRPHPGAARS